MDDTTETSDAASISPANVGGRPLRIWPVVVLLIGMVAARFLPKLSDDESIALLLIMILGPIILGLGILAWWLCFSRARRTERIVGLIGVIAAAGITVACVHSTVMGPALIVMMAPMGLAAFGIASVAFGRMLSQRRTLLILLVTVAGFGFTALVRSDGMWGNGDIDWHWRWEASAEETMLAERDTQGPPSESGLSQSDVDAWLADPEWSRFRGNDGLSRQTGTAIALDWEKDPPQEIWRTAVGPGWSSFVVAGGLLFTQEQLGTEEAVSCYDADTGKVIWSQTIESRFEDPLGGPGPRATPTLADAALYAQGANGQLQRFDPMTGAVIWKADIREVADREPPTWGFSSSPLVIDSVVVVHAGGSGDRGTLAFNVETGDLKWSAPAGDHTYSSPERCNIAGKDYVVMLTNAGMDILDPLSGELALAYQWPLDGYRAVQPQVVGGDTILIPSQEIGTQLVQISESDGQLTAQEVWTTRKLKPDFNDFVIHESHAYGFDGPIFTSIDLESGDRNWKRGRYGKGQVFLLSDQGTLLVTTEQGEVVLLDANPESHQELTRFSAIEGRTWNHPVVIGDRLYLRNSRSAICYQLPTAK